MIYYQKGSKNLTLKLSDLKQGLWSAFDQIGHKKKILIIPPDFTRYHSQAGMITQLAYQYYGKSISAILPALGTHHPMSEEEIKKMYGKIPNGLFKIHNWRKDIMTLGEVNADIIYHISEGKINYPWPVQLNKMLVEGKYDLILSIGQVVPHEVAGMAGYNKNILIGTGGKDGINKSHYLGAVYGMERIMGNARNPVKQVLNYASERFLQTLPIVYVHSVIRRDISGKLQVCGLYIGDEIECFNHAAGLSQKVNIELLKEPLKKVIVYLNPQEYKSTWLGNKSIYRTRMAIADGGELIVLAPGISQFGEDAEIDKLIRKYGYKGTENIFSEVTKNEELRYNLSAAAHLIHGSSEGRFSVTYCPGFLSKEEIESVGFNYGDLKTMLTLYNPSSLKEGYNILPGGEKIYYISNPALGLWADKTKFNMQ